MHRRSPPREEIWLGPFHPSPEGVDALKYLVELGEEGIEDLCQLLQNTGPMFAPPELRAQKIRTVASEQAGMLNASCGVLALFCGSRRIVFPGDAPIEAFRAIYERKNKPIPSDILAVSHHGGLIWPGKKEEENFAHYEDRVRRELRWLYAEAFPCQHAIISVWDRQLLRPPAERGGRRPAAGWGGRPLHPDHKAVLR